MPLRVRDLGKEGVTAKNTPITILQLSDLHFHGATVVQGQNRTPFLQHLDGRLAEVQRHGTRFDLVAVTGDLVDSCEIREADRRRVLENALTYLKDVCRSVRVAPETGLLVIPGNHDFRWTGNVIVKSLRRDFDDLFGEYNQHTLYKDRGLLVACFDSNHTTSRLELAKGRVDLTAFENLAREAANPADVREAAAGALKVALVHHHPLPIATAEELEPRSWVDRALGRRAVGAPEFMLLRNSGSFLNRLFHDRFRLVLHGHLHRRGYWLPMTFRGDRREWLEVISCGSAGAPPNGDPHTFNIIKIFPDVGVVEVEHVDFGAEGLVHAPRPVTQVTANYDLLRSSLWEHRAAAAQPDVTIESFSKRWDVILPEGDVLATEVYTGLRAAGPEPVPFMKLWTQDDGVTRLEVEARALGAAGGRVRCEETREEEGREGRPPRFTYKLVFNPPLGRGESLDIVIQRRMLGVLDSSVQDQGWRGTPPKWPGHEALEQTVTRRVERMLINVRFFARPGWEPNDVELKVLNAAKQDAGLERQSGAVQWDFWNPSDPRRRTPLEYASLIPLPEVYVSVFRPQVHHTYLVRWRLPTSEPIPADEVVRLNQRRALMAQVAEGGRPQALALELLDAARTTVVQLAAEKGPGVPWSIDRVRAYLFCFNRENSKLVCRAKTCPEGDPLVREFVWGKDFIGTSVRRRQAMAYLRSELKVPGALILANLPTDLRALVVSPLYPPHPDGDPEPVNEWPVALLALASYDPDSALEYIAADGYGLPPIHKKHRRLDPAFFQRPAAPPG